jgi:transposase
MARRSAIRDDQWHKSEGVLPGHAETVGVTAKANRLFVDAVLSRYRAGLPWRDLPERCGGWKHVPRRWSRWAARGVWARGFKALAAAADNAYAMIDSTIVRAHQHSAGAKGGTGRRQPSGGPQAG